MVSSDREKPRGSDALLVTASLASAAWGVLYAGRSGGTPVLWGLGLAALLAGALLLSRRLARRAGRATPDPDARRPEEPWGGEELRQVEHVQRLESLELLAGGIAHDFNNLLVGILGNADLLRRELVGDPRLAGRLRDIEAAGRQAAELTRQLLAYAGKGRLEKRVVDLSSVVRETDHLLRVSTSRRVELREELAEPGPRVEVDVTQMRQILINLVTNASESIGARGGTITVRTGSRRVGLAELASARLGHDLGEGEHAYLEVADDGRGIEPGALERLFEPHYTTKVQGRGLGLAAVLGIVRAHRGAVGVASAPGRGATFTVLLPLSPRAPEPGGPPPAIPGSATWRGSGTVLVLDDDEVVRRAARRILERVGFAVRAASSAAEGRQLLAADPAAVVLILAVPRLQGLPASELFPSLARAAPGVPLVAMGGPEEEAEALRQEPAGWLEKPFDFEALVACVRRALAESGPRAAERSS